MKRLARLLLVSCVLGGMLVCTHVDADIAANSAALWKVATLSVVDNGSDGSSAAGNSSSTDVYQFKDPALRDRFLQLTKVLRCPKCQDQSIGDSQAEIAADMRAKTAELLRQGKSNDQIVHYFVARYGDFVTFDPPWRVDTALVWLAPVGVFLLGLWLVIVQLLKARRRMQEPEEKTEDSSC
jgi:cytochrome c-type biogenesis protein CcmH